MKHKLMLLCIILVIVAVISSCNNNGRKYPEANQPGWQEKVFVVNIKAEGKKLDEYLNYHQHIWPEVEAGFRKAGYRKITLSRYQNLVVMCIETPSGANLDSMGKVAESYNIKCKEWNTLMQQYQTGVPGTAPGQTWVETKPFYTFEY